MNNSLQKVGGVIAQFYVQYLQPLKRCFNQKTQDLDFFGVCFAYSVVFLLIAYFTRRPKQGWIAKNHEILSFRERVGTRFMEFLDRAPVIRYFYHKKLKSEQDKVQKAYDEELRKSEDSRKATTLPVEGMTEQNLKKRIDEWLNKENSIVSKKTLSGSIYVNDNQFIKGMVNFSKQFLYQNPLHLDTFKQLTRMQSEVLNMTGSLLSLEKVYGSITSGGTQSLILAVYAYRQYYKKPFPNVVAPVSVHAAIDKACFYFNIQLRKAKLKKNFEVDIKDMKRLIDSNTIMIIGSAPSYPYGVIDPIQQLAKLAKKKQIGMHVDACLGGFVLSFAQSLKKNIPFSFKVDGVTSMSIDHHKYALAPKGVSAVFFKSRELRQCQYYAYGDWCGGLYATATTSGSRSGIASAGAWYAMVTITFDGYKEYAKGVMQTTVKMAEQLRKIQQIQVYGNPQICVFSFKSKTVSSYALNQYMKKDKNWDLSILQRPLGIHVTVTPRNMDRLNREFIKDIKEGIEAIRKDPKKYIGATQTLYGGAANIPDSSVKQTLIKISLGSYFD